MTFLGPRLVELVPHPNAGGNRDTSRYWHGA